MSECAHEFDMQLICTKCHSCALDLEEAKREEKARKRREYNEFVDTIFDGPWRAILRDP